MSRRTRSQIESGYARLQRRKRHEHAFDGDILDHTPTFVMPVFEPARARSRRQIRQAVTA